ncbi:hypothetical protein OSB04_026990 [Centaurea solstitialis]|uniref:Reverse transcriptase Ty1/copia-type domain-containing protein n=1 Tax=Centaurea solstitialis TaxID=347529 RepID=A0AA38W7T1_9ASTR|nr:hypothetical protein OSB04_026990 [Centaurea solstitialis]
MAGDDRTTPKSTFHPAFGVNNIKNSIPLTLNQTDDRYASWVELFHIHLCAYDVLDHIDPKTPTPTDIDKATWNRLDAIVKQWILATISPDLLQTIMKPGASAQELWNRLAEIFQDNRATRAVYLEEQLNSTRMDAFSNAAEYCNRIKSLSDQLANVGQPVSDQKMVLTLVAGLPKEYDTLATFIQQSDPLPSFIKARSQLALEETRRSKQDSHTPQALVTQRSDSPVAISETQAATRDQSFSGNRGGGRGGYRGRGRGRGGHGRGRGGRYPQSQQQYSWSPPPWFSGNTWSTTPHKLTPRSIPCVFLGYPLQHRGYLCHDLSTKQFFISRHVTFVEDVFPFASSAPFPIPSYDFLTDLPPSPYFLYHSSSSLPAAPPSPPCSPSATSASPVSVPSATSATSIPSPAANNAPLPPAPPPSHHHMQTRSKTGIFKPKLPFSLHTQSLSPIPSNPKLALLDPNWKSAMVAEFTALLKQNTWDLVPRPLDANIIRCHWLFRHKFNADGSLARYKARLVVNGKTQEVGIDCDETFSPVVKPATIRTVLSIAVGRNWPIHQLDVKNAFLHGDLNETVYMYQPPGFSHPSFPGHVCRLRKSLYGLKQAPRAWYHRFAQHLLTMDFKCSKCDNSLFIYRHNDDMAYLLLYVDDIVLTCSSVTLQASIIAALTKEFDMTDLGTLTYFLGVSVTRSSNGLFLSQRKYAESILKRAHMENCKPIATPVDTNSKLSSTAGQLLSDSTAYRSLAGALQYLTFTRPDIAYAVQQICLFMHAPREPHYNALKRILRYLQGTLHLGLQLYHSSPNQLVAYTDADWGGCPDTRRSTSGYCVFLGDNLISWSAKRQPTLSRSSAEAEYRGVANAVAESCWLRNLLLELHTPLRRSTLVYCDNVSAVYLSGNPVQHQRTKHIELDIHFVREKVALGHVRVLHVPSAYQYADIFTKGLPRQLFLDFRDSLSIRPPPAPTVGGC